MTLQQLSLSDCQFGAEFILGHYKTLPSEFAARLGIEFDEVSMGEIGPAEAAYLRADEIEFVLFRYLHSGRTDYTAIALPSLEIDISRTLDVINQALGSSTREMWDMHPNYEFSENS